MSDLDQLASYDFDLPAAQIATHPVSPRSSSRMLVLDGDVRRDQRVADLADDLRDGDLLVVNDARVSPVRLQGERQSGGQVEIFVLGFGAEGRWEDPSLPAWVAMRSNRRVQAGETLRLPGDVALEVLARDEQGFAQVRFVGDDPLAVIGRQGQMPLPPYIVRRRLELEGPASEPADRESYQTVYARSGTAVAAPTAGLHFDDTLLAALALRGVRMASLTLEVGLGTFAPVRGETLSGHTIHGERYELPQATVDAIAETRSHGGRVVAVGTTSVRALESAARTMPLAARSEETQLFIRPGFEFRVVDVLMTNFHLPRSTLLAMVSAFGGHTRIMAAYRHALGSGYRFYSYGDSMLILNRSEQ